MIDYFRQRYSVNCYTTRCFGKKIKIIFLRRGREVYETADYVHALNDTENDMAF